MKVTIEPVREAHIQEVISNLRDYDRITFSATVDPFATLRNIVNQSSESFVGLVDGKLFCLWGVNSRFVLSTAIYMWMVTTPRVERHPLVFARYATRVIGSILDEYDVIEGNVVAWNTVAIKWVTWLGATLKETPVEGVFTFELRRDSYRHRGRRL